MLAAAGLVLSACGASDDAPSPPIGVPAAPRPITVEWAGELCSAFEPTSAALAVAQGQPLNADQSARPQLQAVAAAVRETTVALPLVGAAPTADGQVVIEHVGARFNDFRSTLHATINSLSDAPPTADAPTDAALATPTTTPTTAAPAASPAQVLAGFTRADIVAALGVNDDVQDALTYAPACAAYPRPAGS
jgi:hypothetical protein